MAFFARDTFTAGAAQTDFTISFPFLQNSHVIVTVDGVAQTEGASNDYTIVSSNTVRFNTGLTGGETVVLTRKTSQSTRLIDWSVPSNIIESDLDNDSLQAFYMAQEAIDQSSQNLSLGTDDNWDAESKLIKNLGTPTAASDAATKNYVDAASLAASVPDDSITNTHLADMAAARVKGRASGAGSGDPTDLTAAQVETILTGLALLDGTRAFTGAIDLGGNAINNVGNVDGRDVSADGTTLDGALLQDGSRVLTGHLDFSNKQLNNVNLINFFSASSGTLRAADGVVLTIDKGAGAANNHVNLEAAPSGNSPKFTSAGSDANVDLLLEGKGTGDVKAAVGGGSLSRVMRDSDYASEVGVQRRTGAGTYSVLKDNLSASAAPGATDDTNAGYAEGSLWVDTTADKAYLCMDATASSAVWTEITAGGGLVFSWDFESAEQTVTTDTVLSVAHGLGSTPILTQVILRCKTAEFGYSIGDEVVMPVDATSADNIGVFVDSTNINVIQGAAVQVRKADVPTAVGAVTVGNWKWVLRASA